MMNNNLVIAIPNVAEISIENCEQKLVPNDKYIDFVYDLNNKMRIIGDVSKKKFLSEITFYDSEINKNIWLGASVNVACIAEITENFDATQKVITLSRVPVTSSLRLFDENNVRLKFHVTGNEVTLDVTEKLRETWRENYCEIQAVVADVREKFRDEMQKFWVRCGSKNPT